MAAAGTCGAVVEGAALEDLLEGAVQEDLLVVGLLGDPFVPVVVQKFAAGAACAVAAAAAVVAAACVGSSCVEEFGTFVLHTCQPCLGVLAACSC